MSVDNSTGKNKEFYELGKKMFDRLNPHIAHNPKVVGYVAPQRTWIDLTDEEISAASKGHMTRNGFARSVIAKLKERNS